MVVLLEMKKFLSRGAPLCGTLAVLFICSLCGVFLSASAFAPPTTSASVNHRIQNSVLYERSSSTNSEGMVLARESDRLLNVAFSALNDRDKYETVLTGLCAKVIDGGAANSKNGLVDPIRLLEEMNSNGIATGPRGIISLVDATALTSDARIMAKVLSLAISNGSILRYGNLQGSINPIPQSSASVFPFGNRNKDIERLQSLPPIPEDDRATEVSQAILFSGVIAACLAVNLFGGLFGMEDLTPLSNLILGVAVTTVVVDNFFDAIVMGGSAVAKMNVDRLPDSAKNMIAPQKEDMPLGIGTGSMTGSVVRGLSRLLNVNTERDCQCEAAAVFTAYSLGLPCFAFQPNSLEGASLVIDSMRSEPRDNEDPQNIKGSLDNLASDAGLLKMLIWLLAPVAMELSKYPQLMSSDPCEAFGFLNRLSDQARNNAPYASALLDALPENDEQTNDYLRWALAEADLLLRNNKNTVSSVAKALAGGAATVGDCVAILEEW